jgi:glyoxylase-like metal-dependent hydrolase (beta-lactamase superfamily II)
VSTSRSEAFDRIEIPFEGRSVNVYLCCDGDEGLLVDSGLDGAISRQVLPAIEARGLESTALSLAVITHADYDHLGGNAELAELAPDCEISCHTDDARLIGDLEALIAERYDEFADHDGMPLDAETADSIRASARSTPVDRHLCENEELAIGTRRFTVIHLPGHSPGHIGLLEGSSGDCYIGDAVMGAGLPGPADCPATLPPSYRHLDSYLASIERLRKIAPERLMTGHFAPLDRHGADRILAESQDFVEQFGDLVEQALPHGGSTTTAAICASVAALGPWSGCLDPAEFAMPVSAHLEAFAGDGSVSFGLVDGLRRWERA